MGQKLTQRLAGLKSRVRSSSIALTAVILAATFGLTGGVAHAAPVTPNFIECQSTSYVQKGHGTQSFVDAHGNLAASLEVWLYARVDNVNGAYCGGLYSVGKDTWYQGGCYTLRADVKNSGGTEVSGSLVSAYHCTSGSTVQTPTVYPSSGTYHANNWFSTSWSVNSSSYSI